MICQSARQAGVEAEGGVKEGKRGKRRSRPQPGLRCLRTAFGANANRTRPNRGSTTPDFPIFTKKVAIPLFHPLEPSSPRLRTEIGSNAVRRGGKRGCGGWRKGGVWNGEGVTGFGILRLFARRGNRPANP